MIRNIQARAKKFKIELEKQKSLIQESEKMKFEPTIEFY
jgi:hypothetical protein